MSSQNQYNQTNQADQQTNDILTDTESICSDDSTYNFIDECGKTKKILYNGNESDYDESDYDDD